MSATTSIQVGLFENDGYTQPREFLLSLFKEQKKLKRFTRVAKPDISDISLDQPLLCDMVCGVEIDWSPRQEDPTKARNIIPGIFKHINDVPEVHKDNPNKRNSEFELNYGTGKDPFREIARLASGLLYTDMSTLLNERGNEKNKAEIIDWLFADTLVFADGTYDEIAMYRFPFTAQFCCMVEEIDYEWLCYCVNAAIETRRERQQLQAASIQKLDEGIPHVARNIAETSSRTIFN